MSGTRWRPLGAAILLVLTGTAAYGGDSSAWVPREQAIELRNVLALDHGSYRDADGAVWVAVIGPDAILDGLRIGQVRGRRPVAVGPPPEGYSLPDGSGAQRLLSAVERSESAGRVSVGTSVDGRPIWAAWFGRDPAEGQPALWVLGAHHGDEAPSYEVALSLAERLADAAPLQDRTVWVVPYVNPDGSTRAERWNSQRTDLNRNYGEQWTELEVASGTGPFSSPESRAIRALADLVRPVAGLALHAGAENIGYVWNYTEEPAPDVVGLVRVADDYAAECLAEDGLWVTNGAAWYVTHGDSNDWSYRHYGTWEYTVEVSKVKLPPLDWLPGILASHGPAVWAFVHQPLQLITVVDEDTGLPLEAQVTVDHGQPRWTVPTSGIVGFPSGAVRVNVVAEGYEPLDARPGDLVALKRRPDSTQQANPRWISGRTTVWFPGQGDHRWLHRRGEDSVRVEVSSYGTAVISSGALRPGWWSVEDVEGAVFPAALGVGAVRAWNGSGLSVDGGEGARAFIRLQGGAVVELDTRLSGGVVSVDHPGPVWVWSNGEEHLLVSGPAPDPTEGVRAVGLGCAQGQGMGHLGALWVSVFPWLRRRRAYAPLGRPL